MKLHNIQSILLVCGLPLLLVGCGSLPTSRKCHHAEVKSAQVSLEMAGHDIRLNGSMQTICDSICVLSLQPMLGIEMLQVRATEDSLWVINRLQRQYISISYKDLASYIRPTIKYPYIQKLVLGQYLRKGATRLTKSFKVGIFPAKIHLDYSPVIKDNPMRLRNARIENYKQLTPDQITSLLSQ